MEGVVVSASKGVMDSVLAKLSDLVSDTCANLIGVSKDILFLRSELTCMNALLNKLEDNEQLDPQVKNWRNQVLEMTYDIEDSIDDFKNNATSVNAKPSLVSKVSNFIINLRARLDTAMQIKELKIRLHDISDRRKRYKIDDCTSGTAIEILDARLPALYNEAASLVGIGNPKEELINWLLDEDQKLKVVSIVGTGGLGKTTLANEVYRGVREHFSCKAFVPVSRTPDMLRILSSMLPQLHQQDEMSRAYDVQYLIDGLRTFLHDKRYLIIVDDLWDVPPWNIIRCAFPQNNQQSRIIVTTRRVDVARACCSDHQYIHYMQPLSDTNSRSLFLRRMSISEDASHYQSSESILSEILKKCGGLPLAIITIASILACQQPGRLKEQWESIQNSLTIQSAENPTLEEMMQILDLSYKSLPHHLKSCFLYLGKYPEDHEIDKVDLVRQWVAEGFVMASPGRDVWDIAGGYFNGLVNRSMIEPIYKSDFNNEVLCCRVHDMILDLILRRCGGDNFITMVSGPQVVVEAQYKVRRLSIDISGADDAIIMTKATTSLLSQVRSLSIYGGSNWVPPLLEFKFLRVLHLKFRPRRMRMDLTSISQLSLLRYLKVDGSWRIVLPGQLRGLKFLQTLELHGESSVNMPSDIAELPHLSHLVISAATGLPDGIGKVKSLRTLHIFSLPKSSMDSIVGLGELTDLLELRLDCDAIRVKGYAPLLALSTALEKLAKLRFLFVGPIVTIENYTYDARCVDDALMSWNSPPFRNLEELGLEDWFFSSFPRWIGNLHSLRYLHIGVKQIHQEDLGIMGKLPSLFELHLGTLWVLTKRIVVGESTGLFPLLRRFEFNCPGASSYLTFEAGAMPNLRCLLLAFDTREWGKQATPGGLHHLTNLKEIHVSGVLCYGNTRCEPTPDERIEWPARIKRMFQAAANSLPARPTVSYSSVWLVSIMHATHVHTYEAST